MIYDLRLTPFKYPADGVNRVLWTAPAKRSGDGAFECSARWFERTAAPAQIKTIYRFKTDQLNIPDDFEVSPEW